ncbi:hypothetical protein [Dongshaea marina]|uniref:hypothetical protein n=1 Tax=Dongshaea marina TaxID=2047966 RepID=UPI00131F0384|nr:hypothetical protein [Dongshaea marina]
MGLMVSITTISLHGESASRAKLLAKEQLGPGYQYYVSSLSTSGKSGSASVTAYTDREIKQVKVQW